MSKLYGLLNWAHICHHQKGQGKGHPYIGSTSEITTAIWSRMSILTWH